MRVLFRRLGVILLATAPFVTQAEPAFAQERPRPVIDIAAGTYLFPDDGELVQEGFFGVAGRFYLMPRLSIGPEVAVVAGNNHRHVILTGNLTFDFLDPGRRWTPFVVVGGGLYSTREDLLDRGTFTSREGAFTLGGGVRGRVNDRISVGAEARIGWEAHLRVNGFVGVGL